MYLKLQRHTHRHSVSLIVLRPLLYPFYSAAAVGLGEGKDPVGSSPVIADGILLQDLCEQKQNCKTRVYVCVPAVRLGLKTGLCQSLPCLVNSHSSSQDMCSASFVWHIIIGYIILPYYCHMIAKHCKESQKCRGILGKPG